MKVPNEVKQAPTLGEVVGFVEEEDRLPLHQLAGDEVKRLAVGQATGVQIEPAGDCGKERSRTPDPQRPEVDCTGPIDPLEPLDIPPGGGGFAVAGGAIDEPYAGETPLGTGTESIAEGGERVKILSWDDLWFHLWFHS